MLDINRIVIQRLVLAWLIVSLLTGATIYIVESNPIDNAGILFAPTQSQLFPPK